VIQTEKGFLLFVLDNDGKAAVRPVQAGSWMGSDWMILDGLKPGDRVIADNLLKLRAGVQVTPVEPAQTKPANAKPATAAK